jgi:hypothetical protein
MSPLVIITLLAILCFDHASANIKNDGGLDSTGPIIAGLKELLSDMARASNTPSFAQRAASGRGLNTAAGIPILGDSSLIADQQVTPHLLS